MAEDWKIFVTGLLTVGLALSAYLWYQSPLKSSRPVSDQQSNLQTDLIDARTWQDPLQAVEAHAAVEAEKNQTNQEPHHPIGQLAITSGNVAVLMVMTSGSPYPEGHETRLDDRYAVVSALGAACYIPNDEAHLDYFMWPNDRKAMQLLTGKRAIKVPFELYTVGSGCAEKNDFENVLVLWINNQEFSRHPLGLLSELTKELTRDFCPHFCPHVVFKIIGPGDSDVYEKMVEEVVDHYNGTKQLSWGNSISPYVDLYSPRATRSDWWPFFVTSERKKTHFSHHFGLEPFVKFEDVRRLAFLSAYINFEYQVPQDLKLSLKLVEELARREIDPASERVVLISEWDTRYGQALPMEFAAVACVRKYKNEKRHPSGCTKELHKRFQDHDLKMDDYDEALLIALSGLQADPTSMANIRKYSYLRGLDGFRVDKARLDDKEKERKDSNSKKKGREERGNEVSLESLERPAGESQYDYVRRLVKQIIEEERESSLPVKVIGVLGSDIFDKLLILQALRKDFPGTLFFTTDLHALLFHENEYSWTRNLIVATAFGLELEPALQKTTPPFRSSYQTSTFFAVLQALGSVQVEACRQERVPKIECQNRYSSKIGPKLFEIGRNGPVDISPKSDDIRSVHPKPVSLVPTIIVPVRLILAITFIVTLLLFLVPPIFQLANNHIMFTISLIALTALLFVLSDHAWRGQGWDIGFPSAVLIAAVLAAAFILYMEPHFYQAVCRQPAMAIILGICVGAALAATPFLLEMDGQGGEPFLFWDGVSTWPTIAIRFAVIILVILFFGKSYQAIKDSNEELASSEVSSSARSGSFSDSLSWLFRNVSKIPPALTDREVTIVWRQYLLAGHWRYRAGRIVIALCIYLSFVGFLFAIDGLPPVPCRGNLNCRVELVSTVISVLSLILLNLFVFDATRLCKTFVDNLIGQVRPGIRADRYRELIRLIAARTNVIGPLVYYPFIALSIMIVSRYHYFDNWTFPWPLIIAWLANAALVFWSAYSLKQAADKARGRAIENLNGLLRGNLSGGEPVRMIIDEVKSTREGSFDHILQQPAVSASVLALLAAAQYYFTS